MSASGPIGTIALPMAPRAVLVAVPGLRYWRTRRAMSQKQLAAAIGVAVSTVARLEAGGEARLATVGRLALALKIDPTLLQDPPPKA